MPRFPQRSNIEVVDILFAVALGEGFMAGVFEFKDQLISAEVFSLGEVGQGFYRVILAFLIIILSWIHYRRSVTGERRYPTAEFVTDLLVVMTYMVLFLFVEAPLAFYFTVTMIWLLYALARWTYWRRARSYLAFGLVFASIFAAISVSVHLLPGTGWEWGCLMVTTMAVLAYRPIDRRIHRGLETPSADQ